MQARVGYHETAPEAEEALHQATAGGLDVGPLHLVDLRASPIDRCAVRIDMPVREALRDGAQGKRLHRAVGFRMPSTV